jgi:hypothetical protein
MPNDTILWTPELEPVRALRDRYFSAVEDNDEMVVGMLFRDYLTTAWQYDMAVDDALSALKIKHEDMLYLCSNIVPQLKEAAALAQRMGETAATELTKGFHDWLAAWLEARTLQ